ncbi:PAS domain-containing protein [Sulfitobacter donghicola]|nr:PAS domain-containing protein [Sulfitobacter donghicola]
MSDYQPHCGYAPLSVVEAYWEALRAGRQMPKRAEIDPRGIETALEYAFILERVAPGVARMRVAGSHLHDVMGMEPRGMPLTAFFEKDARIRIAGLLEEVFQTPCSTEVQMVSTFRQGIPQLNARMVLLPLKSDLGDVSRILGCFVSHGELTDAPNRFEISDISLRKLDGTPLDSPVPAEPEIEGFSEPSAPFEAAPMEMNPEEADTAGSPKRPPYLRLVKSD